MLVRGAPDGLYSDWECSFIRSAVKVLWMSVVVCVSWMTVLIECWGSEGVAQAVSWLGLWVVGWSWVWWGEWELAGCVLDWVIGWLFTEWFSICLVVGGWGSVWMVSEWVCDWVVYRLGMGSEWVGVVSSESGRNDWVSDVKETGCGGDLDLLLS